MTRDDPPARWSVFGLAQYASKVWEVSRRCLGLKKSLAQYDNTKSCAVVT